ncbi:MAG: hypothetical protein DHS20C16_26040 [Phycisphaerae bacterium]|nr:MAG: hypothetical protein DHS20C16_26040 [Phycisphaerae bacterium]
MLLTSLSQLNTTGVTLLAQDQDWDWGNMVYLGVLALFGALNWVVAKYKEWIGDKSGEGKDVDSSSGDVVYDVTLDDDEDLVLKPRRAGVPTATRTPNRPAPPRQPTPPRAPVTPARPAQPVARPTPPTARPAVPQPVQVRQAPAPRQTRRAQSQSTSKKKSSQQTGTRQATRKRRVAEAEDAQQMNIAGVPVRSLRDAVILSEILAPPLAIRQMDGRESGFDRPNL